MIKHNKINNIIQAKNWLIDAWKLFKKKPLTWVFMLLIFDLFLIVGNSFFIGKFVVALLLPVLAGGIFIALDKASKGEPIGLENLFSAFKDKPVLKELLTVGVIGVGVVLLTMALQALTGTEYMIKSEGVNIKDSVDGFEKVSKGGLFTSLIPWCWSWALLFGIPLVAIKREAASTALKHSLFASLFNFFPLFIFLVMLALLTIISMLTLGLGLLILIPIAFGASYFAFKEICGEVETDYASELGIGLTAISEAIQEDQEEQSVVFTNDKEHHISDTKDAYRSLWFYKLLGMALVTVGVIVATYSYYSLQTGTNTIGKVVSVETHHSRRGSGSTSTTSTTYRPTFSFTDKHGEQHTAATSSMSSELNYPVGALVKINYNPNDYSTVQINSIKSILFLPIILWLFGVPILWFSIVAKKDVDKNGVPPRKSIFLKQGSNSSDVAAKLDNAEINNVSDILDVAFKVKQDTADKDNVKEDNNTDEFIDLGLPKKFTLDFYDEYMHITLSWFGKKTMTATLLVAFYIGFNLAFFFSDSTTTIGSPLIIKILPWIEVFLGVGVLYYALATWVNKTHIFVGQNAMEIIHKPLPWLGHKRLDAKNIKQLYSTKKISRSTTNNHTRSITNYYLHVVSFDGDDMSLLNVENSEQALFLEKQIEKYLGIKNLKVRGEIG